MRRNFAFEQKLVGLVPRALNKDSELLGSKYGFGPHWRCVFGQVALLLWALHIHTMEALGCILIITSF